jgi:simple sugar transport system ATP-binding protein
MEAGIATVYQDLAMIPLMSVSRNFFMGNEPVKQFGPMKLIDHDAPPTKSRWRRCARWASICAVPDQAVGTLSGGERQTVAIARAVISAPRS